MLTGIDPNMPPDLLHILASMGHGDEILVVDANYPAASTARHCQITKPVYLSNMSSPEAIALICSVMPIDGFIDYGALRMEIDNAPDEMGSVHSEAWQVLEAVKPDTARLNSLERQDFYIHAKTCYAVVRTSEARPFGCFILRKGVIF